MVSRDIGDGRGFGRVGFGDGSGFERVSFVSTAIMSPYEETNAKLEDEGERGDECDNAPVQFSRFW